MTAVAHTKVSVSISVTGTNLTDSASFQALVAGAGNGATYTYNANDIVILKNTTGGDATYTFVVPPKADQTAVGATITSPTVVVAAGVTKIFRLGEVVKNSSSTVTITCDVAGSLLVLNLGIV